MNFIEMDYNKNFIEELNSNIIAIKSSNKPLVIRNGLKFRNLEGWYNYLQSEIGLKSDKRHFGFDESLVNAKWWEISYQPEKETSYAYSKTRQPLHTDNAWFSDPAEMNFFIMLKQAETGGEQSIYTVEQLILDLELMDPALLHDLKTIPVVIKKGSTDEENRTTIIIDDENPKIFWNYYRTDKSSFDVNNMCVKFFKFLEGQESTDSVFKVKLNTGDCLAFNDSLVLHGREQFEALKVKDRVICQSMWNIE